MHEDCSLDLNSLRNLVEFHVREGTALDPSKTFVENGIDAKMTQEDVPDIRIRLKIMMNPTTQMK